jgi:biopolymer transport protein ExbD
MAVPLPEPEDTELNMTPMIDIVFQLIVFFLLTLKFTTIDHRIDSQLPKDKGMAPTPTIITDTQPIKVKLFRRNKEQPDQAYTLIRVNNGVAEWQLPAGPWPGVNEGDWQRREARRAQYDKIYGELETTIRTLWEKQGKAPEVKGEISVPPPHGPAVPHGDVVRVLDTFLASGMTNVEFEGDTDPTMRD